MGVSKPDYEKVREVIGYLALILDAGAKRSMNFMIEGYHVNTCLLACVNFKIKM